jgi:uncharacterized protein YecE (DUF72 family)
LAHDGRARRDRTPSAGAGGQRRRCGIGGEHADGVASAPRRTSSGQRGHRRVGRIRIGISGYDYKPWRGRFYPEKLPARAWLSYAASVFDTIELNGTFYSLKSPDVYRRWVSEVPREFLFAVKGSRFVTHNLKLRNARGALANFFASGVLALGRMTGPFLWQLPGTYRYDPERMEEFLALLPRDSLAAAELARDHDHRLRRGALVDTDVRVRYRHTVEVRHPSYFTDEFADQLRARDIGFVVADTAGKFPYAETVTSKFVYVRLHGSRVLYASDYTDEELDAWAARIRRWTSAGLDVYVYFDNDAKVHAPFDAIRLRALLDQGGTRTEE